MCMYSIYNSICRAGLESESAGSAAFGRWSQSAVDAQLQSAGVSLALGAVPPKSRLASRLQHGKVGARRAVSTVPLVEGPVAALQQVHLRVAERRVAIGVTSAITLPQITRPSTKPTNKLPHHWQQVAASQTRLRISTAIKSGHAQLWPQVPLFLKRSGRPLNTVVCLAHAKHVNWTKRMSWIVVKGGSW